MSLIDAAQNRARTFIAILVLLLVAGTSAFITIPKEANPDITIPIIYVSLSHQGISPEDAERLLVRPVEAELRGIEGVKEMSSSAFQGGANVQLEFEAGFDSDRALEDVRVGVELARDELPEDANEPTVNEVNLSLFPVLVVTLSGPVPERTLQRLADILQTEIEGIADILRVNISGERDDQVEIIIDPALLEVYEIDTAALIQNIGRSNRLIAAGSMTAQDGSFAVTVPGLFESLEDIVSMPVSVSGDAVVTVGDLATVRSGFEERENFARINGRAAVSLDVVKRTGANIIDTINEVRTLVEQVRADWPAGVEVTFSQDQSNNIRNMLTDLQNNVLSAILLVLVVIIATLGVRGGLLVAIAIPGSFLTAILVLSLLGMTVNIVVLFALILSVGMLVDGAIVVNEYADRKLSEGEPPAAAYSLAAKRMAWPIITSTATTLAAFAPLMFWPDIVGEFMRFLPLTLIAVLTASLAMALLFVPVVGANLASLTHMVLSLAFVGGGAGLGYFLLSAPLRAFDGAPGFVAVLVGLLGAVIGGGLGMRFGLPVARRGGDALSAGNTKVSEQAKALAGGANIDLKELTGGIGFYVRLLDRALNRPGLVLLGAVCALVFSWGAYVMLGNGVEFFPDIEPEQAAVQIHARGNLSVDEKAELVGRVEREILAMQAERGEFLSVYTVAGRIQSAAGLAEDVIGNINLEFAAWDRRRPADEIMGEIFARTSDIPGIIVEGREQEQGPGQGKPIVIEIASDTPELIEPVVAQLRAYMNTLEGLKDIEDSRPIPGIEWEINVDRAQAAKFGADVALVGNAVRFVTNGVEVSEYRPDGADEEVDIVARFPESYRSLDQLDQVRVTTALGLIPISNFVTRTPVPRTGIITRIDGTRVMTVRSDVQPGVLVDDMVGEIETWIAASGLQTSQLNITLKGENEDQANAQAFLMKAFSVALFLMAVILVTQFNSFYSALLILSAVIMSTVGVMLGLLVIGQPFGIVMSGVGVIALAGIVVNNNIVLIDTYDRLKLTIADQKEAILRTGAQRLRPVMLTTVTTILGLMPMVLQINIDFIDRTISRGAPSTQWWVQLSTAIVAGLTFATVLTLVVTPSALMVRANFQQRRAEKLAAIAAAPAAAAPAAPAE